MSEESLKSHDESLTMNIKNRRILLPSYFAEPITVEEVISEGELYLLRVRTQRGNLEEITVESKILEKALIESPKEFVKLAPPSDFFMIIEASRIRLSYAYDPYFAVSLSGIEALPHQLEAVYERLIPQTRLRFLLADDPGAGKTIMAGLLIKELKLRGAIERILILTPAPLTIQWQDELRSKFDEIFEIIGAELAKNQLAGNVWERFPQCITSIDFAKQEDVWPGILRTEWDLVIIDEAHKCSARTYGKDVKKTHRYQLAERLSEATDKLLLLTATPHQGDVDQFAHFLRLIDSDQFIGGKLNKELLCLDGSPWFLRRMKEELRDFQGRKLFTERHAYTQEFELSLPEKYLYDQVTEYINTFLPRQEGRRRASVALARTVLQRRLVSSLRAITRSLENRLERMQQILEELESLSPEMQARRLREMQLIAMDEEQEADDYEEGEQDLAASRVTASERLEDLRREVRELDRLVELAKQTEDIGEESKLIKLKECLSRAEFSELRDGRGKLLIFTEHRDTLNYLKENLTKWGYVCCEIHGGMDAQKRKEMQNVFRRDAQICVATEAAGEGINLQFCHLMINYDLPWNPNRLEQRMGRIHRIGQEYDVYIFNFLAVNTIEGKILHRLLEKLNEIKLALGGRVFDVIGLLLRLNDVKLEEMLREAAYNPRRIDEYEDQIQRISPERLKEFEEATGIAMATSHVDLRHIREQDYRSEERRLMPEYVEDFFIKAAEKVGLKVDPRADTLWRIQYVPERFRSTTLHSVKRFGPPQSSYSKLTFRKEHLKQTQHLNAELLSPGHPLFAAVTEVLEQRLDYAKQSSAIFIDPAATSPYRLHFFEIQLLGERPRRTGHPIETQTIYSSLVVVLEDAEGRLELAPPDILHDLTPAKYDPSKDRQMNFQGPTPEHLQNLTRWLKVNVQHSTSQEHRAKREREISISEEYLKKSFEASIRAAQDSWAKLAARVAGGEESATLARDEALKRVDALKARLDKKLSELAHLRVVRPGPVIYLGTALVNPAESQEIKDLMVSDPEVEKIAMEVAIEYERKRGWEPTDVSQLKDGSGFDIRSLGPADEYQRRPIRRIEVKGRADEGDVVLTTNEWRQAHRHGDTYWLYVVWNCKSDKQQLITIQNPAKVLAPHARALTIVKGYQISSNFIKETGRGSSV